MLGSDAAQEELVHEVEDRDIRRHRYSDPEVTVVVIGVTVVVIGAPAVVLRTYVALVRGQLRAVLLALAALRVVREQRFDHFGHPVDDLYGCRRRCRRWTDLLVRQPL
jgi:hypothetical protein